MSELPRSESLQTIDIPCILNRASLGNAEYVFVVLRNLLGNRAKVVWVPRRTVLVEEQPLLGSDLRGKLTVRVKEDTEDGYVVAVVNSGSEETVRVPKAH